MSQNIHQIFIANPITSNASTDLMYFGQSPYGVGNDAAMTFTNFSAQFAGNVLTTKGDLYTFSTTNARLAVGSTDGQMLQVSSGAATGLAWSTPTYPSASGALGKFLISDGTNNVYSTSTIPTSAGATANKVLLSDGTNYVLSSVTFPNAAATAGKIIISDGSNWIASTPTYPTSASSTGSFIYANGTNFVASTSLWPNTVGTAGKIVRSDGTTNAYTTSTFADTYSASNLLYSNGANTVTGLATANSAVLVTNSSGVPAWSGTMTNGQVIIGSTSGTPTAATITAGTGISVTNGAASITIANTTSAITYNDVSGTTQSAAVNNGYVISNASQTNVTLPATAALGSIVAVQGKGAGGWILTANTGQVIHLGSSASSTAGTLTSTNQWDAVEVVCVTANTTWAVKSVIGNLTVA